MVKRSIFSNPLVIDGSMSTSLERLGCDTDNELWTAAALLNQPELVYQVHKEYFEAGARLAITDTYQANLAALKQNAGLDEQAARAVIQKAVTLAKQARNDYEKKTGIHNYVAGSLGPYGAYLADGSEYRGDYELTEAEYQEFYRPRIEEITKVGVDCLALETQPKLSEVKAVLDLLKAEYPDQKVYVTFTLKDAATISDGTPLKQAAQTVNEYDQVIGMGINCIPPRLVTPAIKNLKAATDLPIVVYPNSGAIYDPKTKTWSKPAKEDDFGNLTKEWLAAGATIIGGCCTTTPQDIQKIAVVIKEQN